MPPRHDSGRANPAAPSSRRVSKGRLQIGTMNGQPVTANDLIMTINSDSPFMPPLDGSPAPALRQFENRYPANPVASPSPGPVVPPKPPAPSFSEQIKKPDADRTGMAFSICSERHHKAANADPYFPRMDHCEFCFDLCVYSQVP